ncbi:hypothetical protein [Laribacter hongkongensis]|uniref:Uncharacterized protein n=1 Tax=Laribacter hongkongensis TaxID=168471 RepID=A0A248LIF6_9NEIS|nr:hypothetical protein [Laribacter hongkongensis]ASJ24279.1 uncharacterized protein LHGZ1_1448 [Laribacter hongkongensis]MCG9110702.1 hypothetical protein [Laribacter hongkongensis]MCG9122580.1 hypothetical protein [Laribacter hongkongensis]
MDSGSNQSKPSLPSGLSLIEKAQELKWTLQLATAVLFADLLLAWRTGTGIVHWTIQVDHLLANSGFLLVSVLAYGVLMSIIIPLAGEFVRQLAWDLLIAIPWPRWMQNERDDRRPVGTVLPSELKNHAYQKGDRTLLDIVASHQDLERKSIIESLAAGQIVFSVLVIGFFNYFPGLLGIHAVTLLNEVEATFDRAGEFAIAGALLLGLLAMKAMWFSVKSLRWIDYPPLYEELEKARREQRLIK